LNIQDYWPNLPVGYKCEDLENNDIFNKFY